ncbi:MAG: Asp23/Gls24 family envelope stress response protein [Thermoleophilia bacterium]|nr:Asp23/Gls24 family envelope stress response protein [Thermoleophilia bacterium]
MTQPQSTDERMSGDMPVTPGPLAEDTKPAVSPEVIATYVADAARSVPGVVELHASPWRGLSSRVRDTRTAGVVIRENPSGTPDVDIHLKVAWSVYIPDLATAVEEAARQRVAGLLNLELGGVTVFVDAIEGPPEVVTDQEG